MVNGVIYLLLNKINGKMYVGQTVQSLKRRFSGHARTNFAIGKAIRKYGKENFRCVLLKNCASKAEMDKWEKFFIILLNTKKPNGYNLTDGGEGIVGLKHTPEYCAKMSAERIGDRNNFFGKHHKKETCVIMSIVKRGKTPYRNLLAEMDKRQLTRTSTAEIIGIAQQSFSKKILGKQNFTDSQVDKLVEFFGKSAEYLMKRDDGFPTISKRQESPYKNLFNVITERQIFYKELAKFLGLAASTFSLKIRGKVNFTDKDKAKLAEFFNKPIEYLMYKEEIL